MAQLTIIHRHADGTTLEGSAKHDGVLELLTPLGWRWRHWAGIHLPSTRDRFAGWELLNRTAAVLTAAGHAVELDIDDTWRPAAVRYAERGERVDQRVDRLEDRAEAAAGRSVSARDARRAIGDRIPFGQPKLRGHHSFAAHDRAERRMDDLHRREHGEAEQARHLAQRAAGSRATEDAKQDPRAMTRRIKHLETEVRAAKRSLLGVADDDETTVIVQRRASIARDLEEIAYLRGLLADQADTGVYVAWSREHFRIGDQVRALGSWLPVRRVNKLSVSVPGGFGMAGPDASWNDTVPWDRVTGRRRDGLQWDTPDGEPWSVETAQAVARWHEIARSNHPSVSMYAGWAQRIVHGLSIRAADSELAAFRVDETTEARRRELALIYLTVHNRLAGGELPADVIASVTPVDGEPTWRVPDGETVNVRADLLQAGDVIRGVLEHGVGSEVRRGYSTGLVTGVSAVLERHESGRWVTIQRLDQDPLEVQTHVWYAVHR